MEDQCETETETLCSTKYSFTKYDGQCNGSLICTQMEGNACGTFGISLVSDQGKQDVCHAGVEHYFSMRFFSSVDVEVWMVKGEKFALNCMLWCSEEGEVPEKHEPTEQEIKLVEELVSPLKKLKIW